MNRWVITQAESRREVFVQALQQQNIECVYFPLQQLTFKSLATLHSAWQVLAHARQKQTIIFISPFAFEAVLKAKPDAQQTFPATHHYACLFAPTVISETNFQGCYVDFFTQSDAEKLGEWLITKLNLNTDPKLYPHHITLFAGVSKYSHRLASPSEYLLQTLKQQGFNASVHTLYERSLITNDSERLVHLKTLWSTPHHWLFRSSQVFSYWTNLVRSSLGDSQYQMNRSQHIIVSHHEKILLHAKKLGFVQTLQKNFS